MWKAKSIQLVRITWFLKTVISAKFRYAFLVGRNNLARKIFNRCTKRYRIGDFFFVHVIQNVSTNRTPLIRRVLWPILCSGAESRKGLMAIGRVPHGSQ